MSVMVIIKRVFRMDRTKQLEPVLKELRRKSEQQPGFISRSTYSNVSDPGELIVFSEWESMKDWMRWMENKEAKELQWKVDSIIGEKTSFEVYKPEEF
jgi:heme-degrading monooxygenase HmoA